MRRRSTTATLVSTRSLLAAIESKAKGDSSAHPQDENFDQEHASRVIGDIAEQVRKKLADDYDARPPGLYTADNGDGSLTVTADNPENGIGVQVRISLLPSQQQTPQIPQQPQMTVGPPQMGPMIPPGAAGGQPLNYTVGPPPQPNPTPQQ